MVVRTGRLAFGAVVLLAVGLTIVVVVSIASASPEQPDRPDRRATVQPGWAARPWLEPASAEEDESDPPARPDPDPLPKDWTARTLGLVLAACLFLSIIGGALVGVAFGSGLI